MYNNNKRCTKECSLTRSKLGRCSLVEKLERSQLSLVLLREGKLTKEVKNSKKYPYS